jgi:hypothetical protein
MALTLSETVLAGNEHECAPPFRWFPDYAPYRSKVLTRKSALSGMLKIAIQSLSHL